MNSAQRAAVMERWYRGQLRDQALPLIERWQRKLGVQVQQLFVQRMRTRWGSCNPDRATIRLNTDLAKKPRECLEYILVHELVHLHEPTHNTRFIALMDKALPGWSHRQTCLNRLPVRHEHWDY